MHKLCRFAKIVLQIIANQAGCERVFLDLKVKQTQRRNQLGLVKLERMTKVCVPACSQDLQKLTTL